MTGNEPSFLAMVPATCAGHTLVKGGGGAGGLEGCRTKEVYVTLVRCGEFEKLAGEILVYSSLLHDSKLLGDLERYALIERHFAVSQTARYISQ